MNVLFATSEALPFAMSGGLGDVSSALPKALIKRDVDCRVVMPLYGFIDEKLKGQMEFIKSITVPVAWRKQYCGIFKAKHQGVTYFFIDNEYYFKRDSLYGYFDDGERFAFFSRAVLEIVPHINFLPDVIHCNDWQTALVPIYKASFYNSGLYSKIRTVFTIHNIEYQGKFSTHFVKDVLGIPQEFENTSMYDGVANLMKGGIETAHLVTTVSPTYSKEILDPWFSHGLDNILKRNEHKLFGVLNGLDTETYNPKTDKYLTTSFSRNNSQGKKDAKAFLQNLAFGKAFPDVPVLGVVSRLAEHKGISLLKYIFHDLLKNNLQLVILGSGEKEYEDFLREMASLYPQKVYFYSGFNTELAHKIYAGADMFLMPSKSEPCGLAQMIALRYGTIPIVRETGGLADTVSDCGDKKGNGFTFKTYNAHDMLWAVERALDLYEDKDSWNALVKHALFLNYGWEKSSKKYIELYSLVLTL